MRSSTVLSLPLQIGFPGLTYSGGNSWPDTEQRGPEEVVGDEPVPGDEQGVDTEPVLEVGPVAGAGRVSDFGRVGGLERISRGQPVCEPAW
jgi:hypothetical protein